MKGMGYQESDIAKKTGLNPYYLKKKYIPQATRFQLLQLADALTTCVEAEERVKTGRMLDKLSVELLIIGLSTQ